MSRPKLGTDPSIVWFKAAAAQMEEALAEKATAIRGASCLQHIALIALHKQSR